MSEEEIIKEIIFMAKWFPKLNLIKERQAIQGLLDLYNKEKEKYIFEKVAKEEVEELLEDSISKDKIREKIKELEENVKEFEEYWSRDPRKFKRAKSIDFYKLEALQELLEGNNEK